MFTGIIEHTGTVARLMKRGGGARLEINAPGVVGELHPGDSVSVNGACVTVVDRDDDAFACDLVPETVAKTNLGILQIDEEVNLERPMRMADRFGGHIVQGHVDAVGLVRSRRRVGAQEMLEITIPFELSRYLAPQGSVALDGVSLTVVAVDKDRFRVALIPYTIEMTTLGKKGQGTSVNVELDVLSKYVERHLVARMARPAYLTFGEHAAASGQSASAGDGGPGRKAATGRSAASRSTRKADTGRRSQKRATKTARKRIGSAKKPKKTSGVARKKKTSPAKRSTRTAAKRKRR